MPRVSFRQHNEGSSFRGGLRVTQVSVTLLGYPYVMAWAASSVYVQTVVLRTPLSTGSVSIVGDVQAGMDWLPIDRGDKCALIERLPLDKCDVRTPYEDAGSDTRW
jgi:hypothetical protein